MKNFKNYLLVALLTVFCFSCSGDDGTDGVDGIDGVNGVAGADGVDGANGIDGQDGEDGVAGADGVNGVNGIDGQDGADGNANVQSIVFNDPVWNEGSGMRLDLSSVISEEDFQNSAILVYVTLTGFVGEFPVPGSVFNVALGKYVEFNVILANGNSTEVAIVSREADGSFTDSAELLALSKVRIFAVESSNETVVTGENGTQAKGISKKEAVLNELSKAGVDANNYESVASYYGL